MESHNTPISDRHLIAVFSSRVAAEQVADQLATMGVDRSAMHVDDPADLASMISKPKADDTEPRNTKTVVIVVSLIIGALVATPLAFVDFAPHYWLRYIIIFVVVFVIAARALAVHYVFGKSDTPTGSSVLRVATNAASVRDVLEKSDAVQIREVTAPAPI